MNEEFYLNQLEQGITERKALNILTKFMWGYLLGTKTYSSVLIKVEPVVLYRYMNGSRVVVENEDDLLKELFGTECYENALKYLEDKKNRKEEYFYCAGFQYHKANKISQFVIGDKLELQKDPTNKKDPNSVKIIYQGFHIGFIPREYTKLINKLLKKNIETTIYSYDPTDDPFFQLRLKIKELD